MFLYLAQGSRSDIDRLAESMAGRNWISLVYDREREGSIFLPKSTWSEGRRRLYREAQGVGEFEYVVFMDGDATFANGALDKFESCVSRLQPAVAVPVFPRTRRYRIAAAGEWQLAYGTDEQMQAFRREIVDEFFGGSPYISNYDDQSWWYPCVIVQNVIRTFLWRSCIQVNAVFVDNTSHGEYTNKFDPKFIEREMRRLGIRSAVPITANGRVRRKRYRMLLEPVDLVICWVIALSSRLCFRTWDRISPRMLPSALRELIKGPSCDAA